jgi:hypothetical protein
MKLLWVLSFINIAHATNVILERRSQLGLEQVLLQKDKASWSLVRTSNLWAREGDLRLGRFTSSVPKEIKAFEENLNKFERVLALTEKKLKAHNLSLRELKQPAPDGIKLRIGEFVLSEGNPAFEELSGHLKSILVSDWVLHEGIELSKDRKSYLHYQNKNISRREPFQYAFFCSPPAPPTSCRARKWGTLHLP